MIRILCAATFSFGVAGAETGTLLIRVQAAMVAPTATEPLALHWVILDAPKIGQFPNDRVAEKVRALLREMVVSAPCTIGLATPMHRCYLLGKLEGDPPGFTDNLLSPPSPLDRPPAAPSAPFNAEFTLQFTELPDAVIESIQARVNTESWTQQGTNAAPVEVSYKEAAQRINLPGIAALDAVVIQLGYTPSDLSRGRRKPPFTQQQVENALLRVAVLTLHEVHKHHVVPGVLTPPDAALVKLKDEVLDPMLQFKVAGWRDPSASVTHSEDRKVITVQIDNLRIVAFARISVDRGQIENEKGELVNFRGDGHRREQEIREDVQLAQQSLNQHFKERLESIEGTVPEGSIVERLRGELGERKEIRGKPDVHGFGGNLIFGSTKAWVVGKLDAKISLNAAFTAEDLFTGEGTMSGERLLYNILHRDVGETYAFTLRGGPQVQTADFVFGIPRSRGETWVTRYGADLTATYSRDTNQLIGALARGPDRKLTEREKGLLPRAYAEVRRSADKSPWTYLARVETLLDWRHLLLAPNWAESNFTDGQLTAPTLRLRQGLRRSRDGKGISSVSIELQGEGRKGIEALGGDFDFRQYLLTGTLESFFGFQNGRDFRLRYRRGFGAASIGTPAYQFFRLGGVSSVRGIEEGEFVGRGIGFAQAEAAVSARWLWSLIPKKPVPPSDPAAEPAASSPPPPISLDQVYVTVFYDRGHVLARPRVGDLVRLNKPAWGRGIAVELRGLANKANISIGYARSPQSLDHRKGLMIIGVGFDF